MKKTDLIQELVAVLGHRGDAEKAVSKIFSSIQSSLIRGEKVILTGIGSLTPKLRKTQRRHNPNTMEPVIVPPKRIVKFTQSKDLFPEK